MRARGALAAPKAVQNYERLLLTPRRMAMLEPDRALPAERAAHAAAALRRQRLYGQRVVHGQRRKPAAFAGAGAGFGGAGSTGGLSAGCGGFGKATGGAFGGAAAGAGAAGERLASAIDSGGAGEVAELLRVSTDGRSLACVRNVGLWPCAHQDVSLLSRSEPSDSLATSIALKELGGDDGRCEKWVLQK
eukprot:SAG11_NODE_7168_length_1184_cov_1.447005_1_plen_189_part_01